MDIAESIKLVFAASTTILALSTAVYRLITLRSHQDRDGREIEQTWYVYFNRALVSIGLVVIGIAAAVYLVHSLTQTPPPTDPQHPVDVGSTVDSTPSQPQPIAMPSHHTQPEQPSPSVQVQSDRDLSAKPIPSHDTPNDIPTTSQTSIQKDHTFQLLDQVSSAGLKVGIVSSNVTSETLTVRMILTNTTSRRVYYQNARMDQAQVASSENGTMGSPGVAQMPTCDYRYSNGCLTDPALYAIVRFAYVEPGQSVSFSLSWRLPNNNARTSPVSFSLALVGRISDDPPSGAASEPQIYRFPFNGVPVKLRD